MQFIFGASVALNAALLFIVAGCYLVTREQDMQVEHLKKRRRELLQRIEDLEREQGRD